MNHETRGQEVSVPNATFEQSSQDHHDAMEVDSAPLMMMDSDHPSTDNSGAPVDTADSQSVSLSVTITEPPANELSNESALFSNQGRSVGDTLRHALPGSREPPVFDEDTERPRQRRRYHVTVEDGSSEMRPTTSAPAIPGASGDDEVAVLVAVPPRIGDLSINTPRSTTPPTTTTNEQIPMQGVVSNSTPIAPPPTSEQSNADRSPQSPRLGTIPLPDVPPPPPNPNRSPDPVMEAARRLTSAPDPNTDQMQADLALLAPYIAAQAMAAAFPFTGTGGRPPGAGAPNPENPPNLDGTANPGNTPPGGQQQQGQGGGNDPGAPPLPFFLGLPPFLFGGGNAEAPADPKRAERLADGLKVVEEGLLKRWKAVCGDEGAVCAVCYGELLEEPGIEKEKEAEKEQDDKAEENQTDVGQQSSDEDAHERSLRDAMKRRELMEKLERQEKELKLETAVLAFPCGHVFHRTCLLPWLSRHTTCPTCRFDIDPKSDTLTIPVDDDPASFLGPNGFNFGDLFTVGPVLRLPRSHAPSLNRPGPRPGRASRNRQTPESDGPNQSNTDGAARPPAGERPNNPEGSRSVVDLFDSIFRPLFPFAGATPATTAPAEGSAPGTDVRDPPVQTTTTETPAQGTSAQETATPEAQPPQQSPETSQPPPVITPTRPNPPAATHSGPIDYSRPLAMFGRPSPRRPPPPITPAWMRPPRPQTSVSPAAAVASTSSMSASTSASTSAAEAVPASNSSSARVEPPSNATTPTAPPASQANDGSSSGLGQLRAIVSNLIPRRLSTSSRNNGSNQSGPSNSTSQSGSQPTPTPLSPSAGIRAILHGPTSLLRDLTSPRTENRGDSEATTSRQNPGDDMPELESDSEDGLTHEDEVHQSDDGSDDDMPPLEPIQRRALAETDDDMPLLEPIQRRTPVGTGTPAPATTAARSPSSSGINDRPPRSPAQGNGPPMFGPPRPPASDNMMDNIITLRIDLGHADGRDETIIVPLLFNPNGRNAGQDRPNSPRPATPTPPRARTPQPLKKWVPPEPIKTFRQVVEEKEREAGWRCDDPACLLGPADDEEPSDEHVIKPTYSIMRPIDPDEPVRYKIEDGIRVYAGGEDVRVKGENPVCTHTLHPECLVTSARINGWGPDHNSKSTSRVTLRCPVCRSEGTIDRQVWDAGVQTEESGES
ncbi:Zf-rbx1 domain containing protein [Ceratobasidium theobromae]|uniref:Zf-rbx1 domain containing protein n=1 Tax=Ceratobasidium theobromae TaxID=1582974 RepID=A0A5N5QWF6_9AGAM|nr:Zf-rbx1 domain containing protein [Ceratobasidium theobromae]